MLPLRHHRVPQPVEWDVRSRGVHFPFTFSDHSQRKKRALPLSLPLLLTKKRATFFCENPFSRGRDTMSSSPEFSLPVFEGVAEELRRKDCLSLSSCSTLLRSFLPSLGIKVKVCGEYSIEEGVETEKRGTFRVSHIVCNMKEEDGRIASLPHLESATLLLGGVSFSFSLLTPFSPLTRLRELLLCNATLETLSPLSSCPSLETLTLECVSVSEKESFSSLRIRTLFVASICLEDVAPFLYPIDLERLALQSSYDFAFPPPPPSLLLFPSIRSLNLFGCGEEDLSCLSSLTLLQHLLLERCHRLRSIGFLSTMRELQTLCVTYSSVRDVSPLSSVPSLQKLSLEGTNAHSFSPIKNLTGLTSLDLSYTVVPDISFLKYIPFLSFLRLCQTIMKDPSPLLDLPYISMVKLSTYY